MTSYMPVVFCEQCGRNAEVQRFQKGNARKVKARCHGREFICDFAQQEGQKITWKRG